MFVVCGEALFDMFADAEGKGGNNDIAFRAMVGGSPFNVAVGLARLGRKVSLSTQLFDDELGQRLEATLCREGVDISLACRGAGATPLALIEVDANGIPRYAFHGLREMRVHPDPSVAVNPAVTAIHVGSVPIVCSTSSSQLLQLVQNAAEKVVSFDPNVRLSFEPSRRLWREQVDRFRSNCDLIKVSVQDIEAIYGSDVNSSQIASKWVEHKTRLVVLTDGENGSIIFTQRGEQISLPAVRAKVVDTVGAGDSFMAAMLCWLDQAGCQTGGALATLTAQQVRSMGDFASLAAARTCSRRGPNLPYLSEIIEE